jgi:hypothetical protein
VHAWETLMRSLCGRARPSGGTRDGVRAASLAHGWRLSSNVSAQSGYMHQLGRTRSVCCVPRPWNRARTGRRVASCIGWWKHDGHVAWCSGVRACPSTITPSSRCLRSGATSGMDVAGARGKQRRCRCRVAWTCRRGCWWGRGGRHDGRADKRRAASCMDARPCPVGP